MIVKPFQTKQIILLSFFTIFVEKLTQQTDLWRLYISKRKNQRL
jgi:hypothetical protein